MREDPAHSLEHVDTGRIGRRVAFFAVTAVVAIAAVAALPGVGEVRDRLAAADPAWVAAAAACSLVSMLGFVRALWAAFDRVVPWRRAVELGFAEQGANVLLPAGGAGGPAFGTLVMRRAGVPPELAAERHVAVFLATSAVSFVALALAGFAQATGLLPGRAPLVGTLLPAAVGVCVLVVAVVFARRAVPVRPAGGRVRLALWRVHRFLHSGVRTTIELLRHGDPLLIAGAVTYYAFDVAALGACFQAFGGDGPPLGIFVLAYTLGHAGALLPTPGGVGGTEGGLIGMFAAYGTPLHVSTAAVLGYRVFQLGLPVLLGSVSLLRIRRRPMDAASRAAVAERFARAGHPTPREDPARP